MQRGASAYDSIRVMGRPVLKQITVHFRSNGILSNHSRKQWHKMGFSCKMRLFLIILYKQKSENEIFLLIQAVFDNSLRAGNSKMGSHFSENILYVGDSRDTRATETGGQCFLLRT